MFNNDDLDQFFGWSDEEVLEMTEMEMYTNVASGDVSLEQFYKWVANKEREAAC